MAHLMKDRTVKFFSRNGNGTQREPHHITTTSLTTTPLHHLTPLPSHHLTHPFPSHLTGKDVASHKTTGIADALRLAFPNHSEVILDGEAVLRDKDGLVLPFGEQGVHKQKAHNDVTCCLLAFDLIGEQQSSTRARGGRRSRGGHTHRSMRQ